MNYDPLPTVIDETIRQARSHLDELFETRETEPPSATLASARDAVVLATAFADAPVGTVHIRRRPTGVGPATSARPGEPHNGHSPGNGRFWVEVVDDDAETAYACDLRSPDGARLAVGDGGQLPAATDQPRHPADKPAWELSDLRFGRCPDALTLWYAVLQTRDWAESYFSASGSDDAIDSNCFDLAAYLLKLLGPVWLADIPEGDGRADCYVMRGGIRSERYDPDTAVTVEEIELGGHIHFWVEATTVDTDARLVCDAWSHAPSTYGEPLVRLGRPGNYIPATDGRRLLRAVEHDSKWADPVI